MFAALYVKTTLALESFKKDQRGVTAIEYAIIGVAMATVLGVAFAPTGTLSVALTSAISRITSAITTAGTAAS